ncbi:hypothetical protein PPAR_a0270 [Pseudoalteromonas paragorgicola KMM 3548]|nr:hypothetical protein [Pseudoalteromonas distincta KMM 3548]
MVKLNTPLKPLVIKKQLKNIKFHFLLWGILRIYLLFYFNFLKIYLHE